MTTKNLRGRRTLNPYASLLAEDEFLNQMDYNSRKRRFGLFSLPGSNALGDDSRHYQPRNHKEKDGSVLTGPKNFLVGDRRKKYFSKPGFTTIGDEYLELDKIERFGAMLKNLSIPHDKVFKSTTHKKLKNMWPYMEDPIRQVKCAKGEDGKVKIGKRNFIAKEGWHTHKYQYMADPYDREEIIRRQERLNHKSKILKPFRSTTKYGTTFSKNWQVYKKMCKKSTRSRTAAKSIHPRPFKPNNPSKKGHEKCFQIAQYVPECDVDDLKIKYIFEKKKVKPWKPTHPVKTKVTTSIMNRWGDQMSVRTTKKF